MSPSLPKTQTVAIVPNLKAAIQIKKDHPVARPSELAPGECLVRMECSGVCHTDLHVKEGDWPLKPTLPLIGGHEGVGEIVAIGAHTVDSPVKVGDRVGIKWLANSCLKCECCRKGFEQNCVDAKLSGFNTDGTFAQYTKSWVNHVSPIPKNMESTEAASILCAGVTVYRAIKYSNTHIGEWIVIPGSGGGLGHLDKLYSVMIALPSASLITCPPAIQYACAMGLRVLAIDTSGEKRKLSVDLGAEVFIDFQNTKDLVKAIKDATGGQGAHAALITATNPAAYQSAIDYLRPGGTLVAVGLPGDGAKLGADIFFYSLQGSYVGNRQDAIESLEIAAAGKIKVHYAVKPLSTLPEIYKGLEEGTVVGRIVLDMKD